MQLYKLPKNKWIRRKTYNKTIIFKIVANMKKSKSPNKKQYILEANEQLRATPLTEPLTHTHLKNKVDEFGGVKTAI